MIAQLRKLRPPTTWNVLKIALALFLAAYVFSKTDLHQLVSLQHQINMFWLVAVFFLYILLTLLKALQYYFLIGRQVGYPQVLNIVVIQNTTSNFIATSAGIASYLALFRVEEGVKLSRAAMAFVLTKAGDLISIWMFLLAASLFAWPQVGSLHSLIAALLTIIGAVMLVFVLAVLLRKKFVIFLRSLLAWLRLDRLGPVGRAVDTLQAVAEQEHAFVFRMVGIGILFSLVYMAFTMAWLYASLQAFSFAVGILPLVFVNVLMQLLSYLPIQVLGGLGVSETTMLYLYGFFYFPQAQLAAVLIGTRLLFYAANLIVLLYLPLHTLFFNRPSRPIE